MPRTAQGEANRIKAITKHGNSTRAKIAERSKINQTLKAIEKKARDVGVDVGKDRRAPKSLTKSRDSHKGRKNPAI